MVTANLHELKAHLSAYVRRVKDGETVIVCERNVPIGEFRPLSITPSPQRPAPGLFRDSIRLTDDFFAADQELEQDCFSTAALTNP